jgi:hypothetical protein
MTNGCCKFTRAASLVRSRILSNTALARRSPTRDTDIMVDRVTRLKIKMRKTQITSCPNSINHRKIAVYSIYPRVYRKTISFLVSRHYLMVWSSLIDTVPHLPGNQCLMARTTSPTPLQIASRSITFGQICAHSPMQHPLSVLLC